MMRHMRQMTRSRLRRIATLLIGLGAAMPADGATAQGITTARLDSIDGIVHREIASHHIPGAVILAGTVNGALYRRAFGERLFGLQSEALTADAIFDLASLTKVIATTTAVMQLWEQGRIGIDAPVTAYWPAFGANGKGSITVRQLLTHISGLRPDIVSRTAWSGEQQALAQIIAGRPVAPPGSRFIYSDINFIVLGEIVHRVSGQPLDQYAAQHIFAPLHMHDTHFRPSGADLARVVPADMRPGEVQDPTANRMGGVAGHAGLFSTADDLARFAQMLLGGGSLGGVRILAPETVAAMTRPQHLPGDITRGLGWDISSDYDSGMAQAFGPGSFGHTGYTGTSLWIDPAAGVYLIILSSRLYPDGHGDAQPLRRDVAATVAVSWREPQLQTGIDVLERAEFQPLKNMTVGLLTNQTGRDRAGRRTIDVLAAAPGVKLAAIFTPEHGLDADREGKVASGTDAATGLPVYSLYGDSRRPAPSMLAGLDVVLVDLQDAGARFYTYPATVAYLMEAAAPQGVKVIILDRPNPIAASGARGPVLGAEFESFTGYFTLPVQHGLTLGELASMFNAEKHIGADLSVIAMQGYRPNSWFDESGLPWVNPSPNLRSAGEAVLYPGLGLIEGTNISVGRGTGTPFEIAGAPWIDAAALAEYLNRRDIRGVHFEPVEFTPASDRYAGQICRGVRIIVDDRNMLDAPLLGVEIASALHNLYQDKWSIAPMLPALGSRLSFAALNAGGDPRAIAAGWQKDLQQFQAVSVKYRLY